MVFKLHKEKFICLHKFWFLKIFSNLLQHKDYER